jgi:hypothetical protein
MAILKTGKTIGVCVHHSVYTPAENMSELKAQASLFNGWHKSKSWAESTKTPSDYPYISYHYLMATDGSILNVTDEKYVKYHAEDNFRGDDSFNLHGISICLTGNYENDKPTEAMEKALVLFIRDIEKRYKIDAYVRGHKETSKTATACPGKNIGTSKSGWLKGIIAKVNDKNYPPVEEPTPEPEPTECEKALSILKSENDGLKTQLTASSNKIEELKSEIGVLDSDLGECHDEMKSSSDRITELEKEVRDLKSQKAEVVKELAEWKSNAFKKAVDYVVQKVVDFIKKLPKKNN